MTSGNKFTVAALVAVFLALIVIPPVVTTLLTGSAPFDAVRQGYPGAGVVVGTMLARSLADLAGAVSVAH